MNSSLTRILCSLLIVLVAVAPLGCDVTGTDEGDLRISGFVSDADGSLPGIRVVLSGHQHDEVLTDQQGAFVFSGLRVGRRYIVEPRSPDHRFEPPSVTIEALQADRRTDFAAGPPDEIIDGINLTALFSPARQDEIDRVHREWQNRPVQASGYRVEVEEELASGRLRVFSHVVDGHRHYAAMHIPTSGGELPVVVVNHGGDGGVDVRDILGMPGDVRRVIDSAILAIPSFRSEPLVTPAGTFVSEGAPSPWDRDVDDALGMLEVVLRHEERADASRVGLIGFSRGAGVGLLMAIRDPRIDAVIDFFGPTDFFDDYVRDVTRIVLQEDLVGLPGVATLNEQILVPLREGRLTLDEARLELVRRSPVLFADHLPAVQVHHGAFDFVVFVSQAHRLRDALAEIGRPPGSDAFDFHIYPQGGHSVESLSGSLRRTSEFLFHHLELSHGSRYFGLAR